MSNFQPQRQPPLEYLPISNNGTAHTSDRLCTTCVSFLMFALYLTMLCDECETSDYGHVKSYQDTNFTAAQCDLCKALIEIEQEKFASRYNCSMTEAHYRLLAMKRKSRPCRMVLVQNCGLVEVRIQTTETLFFTLQFSSGPPPFQETSIFWKDIDHNPDFQIGKRWIEECSTSHRDCSTGPRSSTFPTRLIDTKVDEVGTTDIRIVESVGHTMSYLALSHCWGTTTPLRTTQENLVQHLQKMQFNSLPSTFKDAVQATRELGFRYIWIDSLCIVQDDPSDWAHECEGMCDIYRSATAVICGPTAGNSTAGFLHPRKPCKSMCVTCTYQEPTTRRQQSTTFRLKFGRYSDQKTLNGDECSSPVERRAWILQERLLAPRVLYFGQHRMYWECKMHCRFEDVTRPQPWRLQEELIAKSDVSKVEELSTTRKLDLWYALVSAYTARTLSRRSDKLLAISGLAKQIWSGDEGQYVAGLLKHDLCAGLSWYVYQGSSKTEHGSEPPIGLSPSWSWASSDHRVTFHYAKWLDSYRQTYSMCRRTPLAALKIRDVEVNSVDSDPFGSIQQARLKVEGLLRTAILRSIPASTTGSGVREIVVGKNEEYEQSPPVFFRDRPQLQGAPTPRRDSLFEPEDEDDEIYCLLLSVYAGGSALTGWVALALKRVAKATHCYKRIGLIKSSQVREEVDLSWFVEAEETDLNII